MAYKAELYSIKPDKPLVGSNIYVAISALYKVGDSVSRQTVQTYPPRDAPCTAELSTSCENETEKTERAVIATAKNLFEKNIASSSRKTIVPHRPRVVDILNAIRNIDHFSFLG